jgi:hypothetical protein
MDNLNIYLKIQEPIKFHDVCMIYQPSFIEMLNYNKEHGDNEFDKLLLPYSVTLDSLPDEITEEQKKGLTNFDLLCSSQEIVDYLFVSLKFFCKSETFVDEKGIIFESFNGRLNKNNFDEFAEIILKICGRERPKKEKIPVFKNERQRDIWEKLQEGRRRFAKKNELRIEDVINVCEFGGNSYIPVEEIKKWTLWRILNCYKSTLGISQYKDSFNIYLVSGKPEIIEGKHWTELIKLDYKSPQEF